MPTIQPQNAAFVVFAILLWVYVISPLLNRGPTSLRGRRLLITGAANGVGAEIAIGAAARGARLILWDLDGAALRATAERAREALRSAGVEVSSKDARAVVVAELDVSSPAALEEALGAALRVGTVDSAVCCAAVLAGEDARVLTAERFARVLAVNVVGPAALVRLMMPHLEAGIRAGAGAGSDAAAAAATKGTIVLLSSVMGSVGAARLSDYSASKAALEGFAASLRQEVNRDGLRGALGVQVVCPWVVDTGMFDGAFARTGWALRAFFAAFPPLAADDVAGQVLQGLSARHGRHSVEFSPAPIRWVVGGLRALMLLHLGFADWFAGVMGGAEGMARWRGTERNERALAGKGGGGTPRASSTPRRRRE